MASEPGVDIVHHVVVRIWNKQRRMEGKKKKIKLAVLI
jgi:hypothetical protein